MSGRCSWQVSTEQWQTVGRQQLTAGFKVKSEKVIEVCSALTYQQHSKSYQWLINQLIGLNKSNVLYLPRQYEAFYLHHKQPIFLGQYQTGHFPVLLSIPVHNWYFLPFRLCFS